LNGFILVGSTKQRIHSIYMIALDLSRGKTSRPQSGNGSATSWSWADPSPACDPCGFSATPSV